jgi:AcrR family transcriptional regulator
MTLFAGPDSDERLPLSRDRILRAAVAFADEHGLAALTMRKLGQSLGVEAMSLYNYVANKDELLDGMVDAVHAEIERPADNAEWRPAVRAYAVSTRRALARHGWAIQLMQSRIASGPATLTQNDWVIGTFRSSGFSLAMTAHAFSVVDSYVSGFAQQEASLPFEGNEVPVEVIETFVAQLQPERYPHLSEFAAKHVLQPGYSYAVEFEYGLDLILDGLERAVLSV